ncbi:MAG: PASTA domain-containing protein [Actinomycetota bacterium]
MDRTHERLSQLDDLEAPRPTWAQITSRRPDSSLDTDGTLEFADVDRTTRKVDDRTPAVLRPRRHLRTVAILVAATIVLGLALYSLRGLDGNGAQPMTGPTEALSTSVDPARIPISVRYPAEWYAAVGMTSPGFTGVNPWIGLVISNDARAVPAGRGGSRPGYFRVHPDLPTTYVTVQILRRDVPAVHGPPAPATPLPLSMAEATTASGRRNFRYLSAQIGGTQVFVSVEAGPDASAADLGSADAIVASIRSTEGRSTPLSFAPADGWYDQTYTHKPGSSDPSQAWTSNMPFAAGVEPPAFPDTSTLAGGQILVLAWEVIQGPPDPTNPNFPIIEGPVQLVDPTSGYEGMAPGATRSRMLAQIDGRYIQVEVYFGSQDPSSDMKAAAQSALDRLVVSNPVTVHRAGPNAVTVPDVIGMDENAARRALRSAGLTFLGVRKFCFVDKPAGTVVHQSPSAGAPLHNGANESIDVAVHGSAPSGHPPCTEAGGATTPWTTSMAALGAPAVVHDNEGQLWILVMQDVAPNGQYVAMKMPVCPDGSTGDATISGVHQRIQLSCARRAEADWFGDGTPDGSNPRQYRDALYSNPLYVADDGRLFLSSGH